MMSFRRMNAPKERAARRAAGAIIVAALLLAACGPARNDERYAAEKKLAAPEPNPFFFVHVTDKMIPVVYGFTFHVWYTSLAQI